VQKLAVSLSERQERPLEHFVSVVPRINRLLLPADFLPLAALKPQATIILRRLYQIGSTGGGR
jgi:hypothetical protein